ncbi:MULTISPECIES: TRAP transporter small permease subunit [Rhodopseudomonas]|uniref:TRAP transporter small permease protein n=1 Tax=Rhodopseudomonas palustris TaxID=1076 RepID=A0A0D7E9J6_RHOPL|nr:MULTISPECIES: TRAP transporter small permease subunit [Rhodopseudomonas]KIZ37534.1 C4-dicarboxylate ABC transporter [Rhodopseudomonas palustris]MDF3814245.1 TRAP transporter small permease subunit [Rhodopseudomonas sp. BAL398]WOK19821.1 TRAP transporter small permease subunit [Rhodopseudomonas sp. BAL398]
MRALLGLSRGIDAFNSLIGRWLSWLIVVAVIISATNAIVRKIFDMSSNSFLELQWVLFSVVFLLCSPWTLLDNEHIRIDIINHALPLRLRGWIDMIGHLFFLIPFTLVMLYFSVPFFLVSLSQDEQSFSAGGLPQWPAKSLIMIACVLLLIQAISEIIKRAAMMLGIIPDSNATVISAQRAAELEAERLVMHIAGEKRTAGEKT